jgi:regulator of RNase E activity RraA
MPSCRLLPAPSPTDPALVKRLRALPTSVISDQMERFGAVAGLRALPGTTLEPRLAGPALTVLTRPGDNLAVHQAIDLAEPGDVLVVDAGGHVDRAVMGEIVYRYAVARGIAGVVIDGAVRDGADIAAGPVPVFSRGVTHTGPWKDGPGEIRGPIAVGGVVVCCGDVVVGDADGLVVVPRRRLEQAADGGERLMAHEETQLRLASQGALDRTWLAGVDLVKVDGR